MKLTSFQPAKSTPRWVAPSGVKGTLLLPPRLTPRSNECRPRPSMNQPSRALKPCPAIAVTSVPGELIDHSQSPRAVLARRPSPPSAPCQLRNRGRPFDDGVERCPQLRQGEGLGQYRLRTNRCQ